MNTEISVQTGTKMQSTSLQSQAPDKSKLKPSLALKIFAVLVPLINFGVTNWIVFTMAIMGAEIHSVQLAKTGGSLIGILIFPAVIVGLFQIGKRFRNPRSRWRIFLYASLFSLFAGVVSAVGKLGSAM